MAEIQSYVLYTGNGTQTDYTFSFPYLERDHVTVLLDEVATEDFEFITDGSIRFDTAPALDVGIIIRRVTPKTDPIVTHSSTGSLKSKELNEQVLQTLYAAQEASDDSQLILDEAITIPALEAAKAATAADVIDSAASAASAASTLAALTIDAVSVEASKDAASDSANAASTSETNAAASANAASTSETNALAAASASEASKEVSVDSASDATAASVAASTSETNALAAASASEASATAAEVSKDAAASSETNAAASATAAALFDPTMFLPKSGGTMTGDLDLGGNTIADAILSIAGYVPKRIVNIETGSVSTDYSSTSLTTYNTAGPVVSIAPKRDNTKLILIGFPFINSTGPSASGSDIGTSYIFKYYNGTTYVNVGSGLSELSTNHTTTVTLRGMGVQIVTLDQAKLRSDLGTWYARMYFSTVYSGGTSRITHFMYIAIEVEE